MYENRTNTIKDRRELLKIKLKSLAAESKIIRHEEKKIGTIRYVKVPIDMQQDFYKLSGVQQRAIRAGEAVGDTPKFYWRRVRHADNPLRAEMWKHRTRELREEARLSHIAYGLIRGHSLEKIERDTKTPLTDAQWKRIYGMCEKYGAIDKTKYVGMPKRAA